MALTKLSGFMGEAEVQGSLRSVEYAAEKLSIFGLTLEEAYDVLSALSAKAIVGVKLPTTGVATVEKAPRQEPKKAEVLALAKPVATATPKPTEGDDATAALAGVPSSLTTNSGESMLGDVPEKIAKSGRFIEVMSWVMKAKGLKPGNVDEIVAECERLKDLVPAIRRARNIREKVESNLAAYAEAGDAA